MLPPVLFQPFSWKMYHRPKIISFCFYKQQLCSLTLDEKLQILTVTSVRRIVILYVGGDIYEVFFCTLSFFSCHTDLCDWVPLFVFSHIMCWNEVYLMLISSCLELLTATLTQLFFFSAFLKSSSDFEIRLLWVLCCLTSFLFMESCVTTGQKPLALALGRKRMEQSGNTEKLHPTTSARRRKP